MTEADFLIEIPAKADAHRWLAEGDGALGPAVARAQRGAASANWHFELGAENAHRVEGLHRLSIDLGAASRFTLAPGTQLDSATQEFLGDFVRRVLFEDPSRSPAQRGQDEALLRDVAPQDHPSTDSRPVLAARILYRGCRALARETLLRKRDTAETTRVESPLLIGAYGGEHVGDAAILGGVLLGLHERYGARRVVLGSFCPAHTERLVRSLDVPVTVRVFHYEEGCV